MILYPTLIHPILTTFSYIQASAGLVHVITSAYQTPIVFGARAFMLPGYTVIIMTHLLFVVRNFVSPGDVETVLDQYLALCAFTWVR